MTRALILAAGQGTRLRPLTDHLPKCLVPFAGKSLLERQTEILKAAGINNIRVVGGYLAEKIKSLGYDCTINKNYAHSNMVTSLFSAQDFLPGTDDLIISYGDIIYQTENLAALLKSKDPIAIMIDSHWRHYWQLRFVDPLSDAETLHLNSEGYITELGKKPKSYQDIQGQYTGLIKIRADKIYDLIKFYEQLDRQAHYDGKDFDNMYMTSFIQLLIDQHWPVKAVLVKNGWLEVDSINDLTCYERMLKTGELLNLIKI